MGAFLLIMPWEKLLLVLDHRGEIYTLTAPLGVPLQVALSAFQFCYHMIKRLSTAELIISVTTHQCIVGKCLK